jgi:hypothetical protein
VDLAQFARLWQAVRRPVQRLTCDDGWDSGKRALQRSLCARSSGESGSLNLVDVCHAGVKRLVISAKIREPSVSTPDITSCAITARAAYGHHGIAGMLVGMSGSSEVDLVFRQLLAAIEEFGWAVRHVGAGLGKPAFSYTVGLMALSHPELVMIGMQDRG